ncbi:retrovirus-related pol polyprotein from transposon TNT 1-94 [Tanacetum coccineum]
MFNTPSFAKINFVKSTEQVKSTRKTSVDKIRQNTPSPRGNKRNWNQQMYQRLGSDFQMINKACYVCGSFDQLKNNYNYWHNNGRFAKPVWTNVQRMSKQNFFKLTHPSSKRNMVPRTVLTRSGLISLNTARPVNTIQSKSAVNNAGPMKNKELKDKGVIDSRCSRHMTRNKPYLTDYEKIDGGFVAVGGNSKGGEITRKDFKLTDESHVLLKVPRKDNMYSVDLKNVFPQGGLTCLFAKATPDESNLWHRRLGHVNFKTMNKLVRGNLVRGRKPALSFIRPFGCPVTILNTIDHLGKFNGKADEGLFVGYSTNSKAFRGTKACDRSSFSWKQDSKFFRRNEMKFKTVNAAGTKVNDVDPKTSIELPNDPNMPELEDIVYSDNEEDVGAEANTNNLDAFMPVSPIPTTRIHKDHQVDQIIGDLNSAPQIKEYKRI